MQVYAFLLLGCIVNHLVDVHDFLDAFSIFSALADLQKVKVCQRKMKCTKMRADSEQLTWE